MSEPRILEAITPSRIGGAEVFVADLCERLSVLGANVELFCPAGRPFVDYVAKRGITATTWRTHGKFDPVTLIRLARIIRRVDVVHTHLSTASLLGALAAKLAHRPSVAHVHGLNSATCYRRSGTIIAVSEAVKAHLCAQGIDAGRVHVVHNGVDLSKFEPVDVTQAKLSLGYEPDAPLFGVFARLSSEKGQRVALEALSLLLKDHPSARLMLVGDGRDAHDLAACAQALGIEDSVEFGGFVHDVRHIMSACDAVLVPSLKEGFGLAAVEAMALGRPVIASSVGGLNEIVVHNEAGFLVAPSDPWAVADAMQQLIDDPSLGRRLGADGRTRVEHSFDQERQMGQVLSVLRSAVSA